MLKRAVQNGKEVIGRYISTEQKGNDLMFIYNEFNIELVGGESSEFSISRDI